MSIENSTPAKVSGYWMLGRSCLGQGRVLLPVWLAVVGK